MPLETVQSTSRAPANKKDKVRKTVFFTLLSNEMTIRNHNPEEFNMTVYHRLSYLERRTERKGNKRKKEVIERNRGGRRHTDEIGLVIHNDKRTQD